MAGRKRERYKIERRISVPFMLELEYESKIIKKLLVIKEICFWLQTLTFFYSNPDMTICNFFDVCVFILWRTAQ